MPQAQKILVRKPYLVSESNIKKSNKIASDSGSSVDEIVRQAINAYDPIQTDTIETTELMDLVFERLKGAVKSTIRTNRHIENAIGYIQSN